MNLLLSDPNGLYVTALKCQRSHPVPPLILRVGEESAEGGMDMPISNEQQYQKTVSEMVSLLQGKGMCQHTDTSNNLQIGDEVKIHGLSSALWNGR
jgi:hypothetical protein